MGYVLTETTFNRGNYVSLKKFAIVKDWRDVSNFLRQTQIHVAIAVGILVQVILWYPSAG